MLRALAHGVRQGLAPRGVEALRGGGGGPLACDGRRLTGPRSAEWPPRRGEAGTPGSAPTIARTTLVRLPLGVVWSWGGGPGTAREPPPRRPLLRTLPRRALLVADAS
jgi:hypothetical protein